MIQSPLHRKPPCQGHTCHTACLFLVPSLVGLSMPICYCRAFIKWGFQWYQASREGHGSPWEMQITIRPPNVAASLLSWGLVEAGATQWVSVASSAHPFRFSHSEAHQAPPLSLQRKALPFCLSSWLAFLHRGLHFPLPSSKEGQGPGW